ncbi:MAG: carboxypeptidase regulatory-like domain-containing protein [Acidobacteria bacterium]|nr:carboxypeptidase regulatory-like domain-containing protein [Acidobacteriota bacterium]
MSVRFARMGEKIGAVLLLVVGAASPAAGQSATGLIIGTVTDTSGAVIPNAEITITHLETSRTAAVATNERGEYVSTPLGVGSYQIEAAMASFKRAVRRGVTLEVQQTAVVNLVLEVGQIVESVEVVGDAPLLEATTSTVGKVVDNRRILELPLNTRNVYALVILTPGITGSISQRFDGMNWSVYGTRRRTMDILNRFSNPYPGGLTAPLGSSAGLFSAVGEEFRPKYKDDKVPWAKQWNDRE